MRVRPDFTGHLSLAVFAGTDVTMPSSSLPSLGGVPWFVVLPDRDEARPIADRLRAVADIRETRHRSDRPWILGNWSDEEVRSGDVDSTRITAIGEHGLDRNRLRVPGEQDAGCVHWVTSRDGMVSVRGTVSGLRRVFHARIGGVRVAADRADVLAGLAGSPVDEVRLATRLVSFLPWPVSWRPVWRDVEAVFPGHELELDHRGGWRERRYWSSPAATRTLAAGAQALRSALTAAVDLRVRDAEVVACDLSGLDSTSLCSLAVRSARRVAAATGASPDVMDDDVEWARLTAGELGIDHDVLPWQDTPLTYDGILDADDRFDEPCIMLANRARIRRLADHATANGARIRLAGIGGDELLDTAPAWLHSLARSNPVAAWRIARGYRAKYRWPWRHLVTALADERSYRHSLRSAARHMSTDIDESTPLLGWGVPLLLAPWVTAEARHTIRQALLDAGETAEPLAPSRGLHNTLGFIHAGATIARQFQQMAAGRGVRLALPYFDDAVLNASLSVRPEQRLNPRRYKPLAVEAMRGIVPARTLTRTTKSETSTTIALGLERHRDQILGLAEGSLLAERGLIDPARMRDLCSRGFSWPVVRTLDSTIACEMWLRTTLTTSVAST